MRASVPTFVALPTGIAANAQATTVPLDLSLINGVGTMYIDDGNIATDP